VNINDEILENGVIGLDTQPILHWQKIKPIHAPLKIVDPFQFTLLPNALIPWIRDISERMQCPPDYAAMGAMVTLSAVIGRRVGIKPKALDDWLVVCNLWGVAIGRPSSMKTPALSEILKPLKHLEIEERKNHELNIKQFNIDLEMRKFTGEQKHRQAKAAIKDGNNTKARSILEQAAAEEKEIPVRKRYIISDTTIEKLGELLNENPNGLLLFRDEISGWLKTIDREDRPNDREFWLESFDGNGSYTYDRIGRGTIDIQANITSVIGGIQPSKLLPYILDIFTHGKKDDGFIQRLQLSVYPDQNKEWRYIDRSPDKLAKGKVFNIYDAIANKINFPIPEDGEDLPSINFDAEAQILFIEWLTKFEIELRSNELHPVLESHLTKYRSLIPSLALIIHIANSAEHEIFNLVPVTKNSLLKAICWGVYLRSHTERIYSIGINPEKTSAQLILKKIKENKLENKFTARDIHRSGWSGLSSTGIIKDALLLLEDCNYIQGIKKESPTKSSIQYFINAEIKKT